MNKLLNVIERTPVPGARAGVIHGVGTHRATGAMRRTSNAGGAAIERLVLVSGSPEGSPALESRAGLIARDMRRAPRVVRTQRHDDLLETAKGSDLILADRKQPAPFIVPYLGRAARRVLRKSRAPLLAVSGTADAPYRHVLIATDLQTDIGEAVEIARTIAPGAALTLLHVYGPPFESKLQWAGVPESDLVDYRVDAQREAALGMATLLERDSTIEPARTLLRHGWPVPVVVQTSAEIEADLIVVVRNSRSWWADALGASVSLEIAQRADRDVLVVHAPAGPDGRLRTSRRPLRDR